MCVCVCVCVRVCVCACVCVHVMFVYYCSPLAVLPSPPGYKLDIKKTTYKKV